MTRLIVITGAARGLGQILARDLAAKGAQLVLADIAADEGAALGAELDAPFIAVDLGDPQSITRFADRVNEIGKGRLGGLVNNGAIATGIGGIPFDRIDLDSWDLVMRVNVRGTWLMTRALAPFLRADGAGRVVNIASDTALWGAPRLLSYVASKGAIIAMTRSLARELGPDQVGVTAVAPGILTTPSTDYVPQERHDLYNTGRAVPGAQSPHSVCDTIRFLLTPGALALTGQLLPVNNGFVFG